VDIKQWVIKKDNKHIIFIYLCALILAACSIIYELLIAQAISLRATNTVIWYSLTIGLFLGAMGGGAFICTKCFKRNQNWRYLFQVECFLSLFGSCSVIGIYVSHMMMNYFLARGSFFWGHAIFFAGSFFMILGIGLLTGMELPLFIRIGQVLSPQKNITYKVLGVDYLGSLVGAILFPIVLWPRFDILNISLGVAFLNLIIALIILVSLKEMKRIFFFRIACGIMVIMLLCGFINTKGLQQYFLKKYYYYESASHDFLSIFSQPRNLPVVERIHSHYQNIDFVRVVDSGGPSQDLIKAYSSKDRDLLGPYSDLALFLDGSLQFLIDFEEIYHEYFAHIPIILNGQKLNKVLVLGGGDGFLVRELLKYRAIQEITLVEIDKKMIELGQTHKALLRANGGSLRDKRVKIIHADAYHFIKENRDEYDAIYMDFPDPKDYNLSKLYSREFYHFVRKRLTKDGFAVLDAPRTSLILKDIHKSQIVTDANIYYQTLKAAGFKNIIFYASNLEKDNHKAKDIISQLIGNYKEMIVYEADVTGVTSRKIVGKNAIINKLLNDFVADYHQRFIFVKPEHRKMEFDYDEPGVELFVLNKKRFDLAFEQPMIKGDSSNGSNINSIMRPRFPNIAFWWRLRTPY